MKRLKHMRNIKSDDKISIPEFEFTQFFSGSPLDRSYTGTKDNKFLTACISSQNSRFILSNSGKLLCRSTPNSTETRFSLVLVDREFVFKLVEINNDDCETLLSKYTVCLLGCTNGSTNEPSWYIAIDTDFKSEDLFIKTSQNVGENYPQNIHDSTKFIAVDGRSLLQNASAADIALAGHTLAILSFHSNHKYSSKSGELTRPIEAGAKRESIESKVKVYPRVDPVAIACVMSPDGQRCLLGRVKRFPRGFYSCLSGFVEQAETVEEAVRREVWEEAGIVVGPVTISFSQPWPIGRSGGCELMIGCMAMAITEDININVNEMEDVRWYSREEVRGMLDHSSWSLSGTNSRPEGTFYVPSERAIAHHLVKEFVNKGPEFNFLVYGSARNGHGKLINSDFRNFVIVGFSGIAKPHS